MFPGRDLLKVFVLLPFSVLFLDTRMIFKFPKQSLNYLHLDLIRNNFSVQSDFKFNVIVFYWLNKRKCFQISEYFHNAISVTFKIISIMIFAIIAPALHRSVYHSGYIVRPCCSVSFSTV